MNRNIKTVRGFADASPFTQPQLRDFIFNERTNGLFEAAAIVRIGRRVYIDVDKFEAWIESKQEPRPAAPPRKGAPNVLSAVA